ncbi:MAG: N-acyl homoserine lactonase family protein [Deltaproteobacteria bacterium]|nr:N-acyl homoserine lactonase family protein [Deltaproteobacteria bacterium]
MKLRLLDFGTLKADLGWAIEAAGVSTHSNATPEALRTDFQMLGALIEHPKEGVILYDTGPAPTWEELWPGPVKEVFGITRYSDENRLDNLLRRAGYGVKDVKAIVLGHMHLDHAGGLEFFRGLDVPIYVHEDELKYSFYAVATKQDFGAYLPHYIDSSFNWKPVYGTEVELFDGITVYLTPGHTPGSLALRAHLNNRESFLFTSDVMFFKDNFYECKPPGWLVRDMGAWWKSLERLKSITRRYNCKVVLGHDGSVFNQYAQQGVFGD